MRKLAEFANGFRLRAYRRDRRSRVFSSPPRMASHNHSARAASLRVSAANRRSCGKAPKLWLRYLLERIDHKLDTRQESMTDLKSRDLRLDKCSPEPTPP